MTIRLVLANNQIATVVSTYAPTLFFEEEVKEIFYACLDKILSRIPKENKIILLGDFNARVGRVQHLWKGTIGNEGIVNINTNGVMRFRNCDKHGLIINKFQQSTNLRHLGDIPAHKSGISLTM